MTGCALRNESFAYELSGCRSRPPGQGSHGMTQYLISFDAHAMDHIPDDDMPAVAKTSHSVVQEAISAGVFVSSGGLEDQKASIVATDGTVTDGPHPEAIGGFCIVDVPSREEALEWAAKTAGSTSASGTARASTSILPAVIASARAGSSARYSCPPTDPWPLPMTVSRAARNAADGIAAVGPATEPISTQVSGFPRSARAVMMAAIAAAAGSPHR